MGDKTEVAVPVPQGTAGAAEGEVPGDALIVVGSSAGGVEALIALVAGLPVDLPAPLVLAQHLDPTRPSQLGAILARHSPLPVRAVEDRAPLAPGVVYVVPSNRHVAITDHALALLPDGVDRPAPSIDLLLASAAEVFGERLIAVVLTGRGADGADGARAVKAAGGTVIIQDPATAAYPSMPLAIAPPLVDIVVPLARIGPLLGELLDGGTVPDRPESRRVLDAFLAELRERFGIDFGAYKRPTLLRRLRGRIAAVGAGDITGYLAHLAAHPGEYQHLVSAFLIKVTEFFRDPALFDALRDEVLPEMLTRATRRGDRELRLWSAGCATGEEAYSLAILIAEALGPALEEYTVRVFATDLDADAVAHARRGLYPPTALAALPPALIERYFTREDGGYLVRKPVRNLLVFGQHDLGQRPPFPRLDLVLCRNVLIYFTPPLQRRALEVFAYALRDGGTLALGKSESVGPAAEYFTPRHPAQKLYRRTDLRIALLPAATGAALLPVGRLASPRRGPAAQRPGLASPRGRGEQYLLRLPTGVVVVDRRYDIQELNGAARRLLGIHGAALGDDLIHVAQGLPGRELRGAIDGAFRGHAPVALAEIAVEDTILGEPRYLRVECVPQAAVGDPDGTTEVVLVVVNDLTAQVRARRDLEAQLATVDADLERERRAHAAETARREGLIGRLTGTNRQLLEANQELHSVTEELRATGEESQLATEEAQAATEEAETLNEELQATNEELETLNEELQATVEELNATTGELEARGGELTALAQVSEERRARLEAILAGMGDAVLVVDAADRPLLHNAAYARLFGSADAPFPAADATGLPLPPGTAPRERLARGGAFADEFTLAADGVTRWFEAVGTPIRDPEGRLQWGVLVIRDITARSLQRLQDEFLALASHELRSPLAALGGYVQLIARALDDRVAGDAALARPLRQAGTAREQVERLDRLVGDLTDVARLQSGRLTLQRAPAQLDAIAARAVELAQTIAPDRTIRLDIGDPPFPVDGDTARLEQALLNLLTNALRHAPGSAIDVRLRRAGDTAALEVRDDGPGIPAVALPDLFSRFYQVRRGERAAGGGLGLGLFIAREIVVAHGGTIAVASVEGAGSTFTIRLPLTAELAEATGTTGDGV